MSTWIARHGMTSAEYQHAVDQYVGEGYRLAEVSGYGTDAAAHYAAIFEKQAGPAWSARHGLTSAQYQAEVEARVKQGYRLVEVSGYAENGDARYAAIFATQNGVAWTARHGLTAAQYQAEVDLRVKEGYRLRQVSGYTIGGSARYAAIFDKSAGPAWSARHGLTSAQYQAEVDLRVKEGYRLVQVSGYAENGSARYAAIFEKSSGPAWVARHGLTSAEYQSEVTSLYYQGYRPVWVSGYVVGGSTRYAAIWHGEGISPASIKAIDTKIGEYLTTDDVPGVSIAISKQERLVFAKGYGVTNTSTGEKVDPSHLFRVASISKPITAVAIVDLVEDGKLAFGDKVFGAGALLGTTYGTKAYSSAVKAITVRHLLQHTSGWSNDGGDPMFKDAALSQAQLIGWMLDNRAPKNQPGAAYEYLNFGYCVLGRIIEKVTGKSYETHVKGMLASCGITRMAIGGKTEAERKPGEVRYHGGGAYNLLPARMDAHGGWIASPIDLLRMMARTDGFSAKMDILNGVSEDAMFSGSPANAGYGMGWIVGGGYRGHNGAMSGTIGFLVRRDDGMSFAVLVNQRPASDEFCFKLKAVLDGIVTGVTNWPAGDLF
ncbi:MAG TPA: serine hydrolase [Solirubrobacteraceae bacterium]|jgi:CubicO group peptidase (beta-lactamase class C family)|nr:serine hydrolase [Solirubrobacteraceae bacterium]